MRRSPLRFSKLQAGLSAARSSSSARFNVVIIPKKKPPGNEKKISDRTTHTFLLANPNLEGEFHLKGGRFVTSQFSIWMFINRSFIYIHDLCIFAPFV